MSLGGDVVLEVAQVLALEHLLQSGALVRVDTGYAKGAVHDPVLAAEEADPDLHHHEVTHSHPFDALDHTHAVADLPAIEKGEHDG